MAKEIPPSASQPCRSRKAEVVPAELPRHDSPKAPPPKLIIALKPQASRDDQNPRTFGAGTVIDPRWGKLL